MRQDLPMGEPAPDLAPAEATTRVVAAPQEGVELRRELAAGQAAAVAAAGRHVAAVLRQGGNS